MRARGQALVLFALLMLTTLLMAFMTVSLSERAKERIELQSAADQAAWNNAVATARVMNASAFVVRAQIAHFAAAAGAQALVSFAGSYRGYLNALDGYYRHEHQVHSDACNNGRRCGCDGRDELATRINAVTAEQARIQAFWRVLDGSAGQSMFNAGSVAFGLQALANNHAQTHLLNRQVLGAPLAAQVVGRQAAARPGWRAAAVDSINAREIGIPMTFSGAILQGAKGRQHGVFAAMGSIGNPFATARLDAALTVQNALRRTLGNNEPVVFGHYGNTYFSADEHGNGIGTVSKTASWADDHGLLGVHYQGAGCGSPARALNVRGWLKATDTSDATDAHGWLPSANPTFDDGQAASVIHTANICTNVLCPAMFFYWQDYNQSLVNLPNDAFGQPKNYAVTQIDRRQGRVDPFNLTVRIHFAQLGPGAELSMKGLRAADGTDLSRASALSAGMAYYHRRDHWKEPPNLFNPFWRAGLVRADIDEQARTGDLWNALAEAADPLAAEAARKLYAAGYRGIP